jgi:hypothetical protein
VRGGKIFNLYTEGGRRRSLKKEEKAMPRVAVSVALTPCQRRHCLSLVGRIHKPTPTARDVPRAAVGVASPMPMASLRRRFFWRAGLEAQTPTAPTFNGRRMRRPSAQRAIPVVNATSRELQKLD